MTDGPDVAFNVRAGKKSKTVEVFASEFFSSQFTVVVIDLPSGEMVGKRIIDDTIGAAYMVKLADLNGDGEDELLVTNHAPKADSSGIWAYEMPVSEDMLNGTFTKHELARGFPVRERGFNQAAPGFAYVVYPHVKYDAEPVILIAGDGSTSAYELVWRKDWTYDVKEIEILGGTVGSLTYDDIDADGYTEVFIPNYDKGYVEIWTYAPIRSM